MDQEFLSVTSFLDPRFQNLTRPSDYISVKAEIQRQHGHMGLESTNNLFVAQPKLVKKEIKLSATGGNAIFLIIFYLI